jgi:PAS domain S-box-containing protein
VKFLKDILIQPKNLIFIFIITAVIIISSVLVELNQSKKEMLQLMEKQSHTLLESLLSSSKNALLSYDKIEMELKNRLLNNAEMIKLLYKKNLISNSLLASIAEKNNIYRINIFNDNAKKIFSSHQEIHIGLVSKEDPVKYIQPIFSGDTDTLIIGVKTSRFGEGERYAIAVSSGSGGAIILNVDAAELINFRKQVGFGILLKNISQNDQIAYVALQDGEGLLAASGKIDDLESISSSEFLTESLESSSYKWRIKEVDSQKVFEAVQPLIHNNAIIGIFRLALSLEPLNDIEEGIIRRLILLGFVLFVFGSVTITLVFVKQNFILLSKRFTTIEAYSKKIVDNVSDAIIVIDNNMAIKTFNEAALKIFNKAELSNKSLFDIFEKNKCEIIIKSPSQIEEVECNVDGKNRIFLLSKSDFLDEKKDKSLILVIRDLTEIKTLADQVKRKERLTEMGKLASSVAHEIRNPLNTIGTITQQLGKDFEVKNNQSEFGDLTKLVYKEVRRINDTIESFLIFSKPQPINPKRFFSYELFEQIRKQYASLLNEKGIDFQLIENWKGYVEWDKKQLTQVFINLMENAIDAININGKIELQISEKSEAMIEILFSDNGKGIEKENLNRIFNLYFTTKTKGSGIGLSIVQKIIAEHNGILSVKSESGKGTTFTITIPKVYS